MLSLGMYLKDVREKSNLTLKQIQTKVGITDSRLSKLENDLYKEPSPLMLKQLSTLYDISIVDLFIRAGYITYDSLDYGAQTFKNVDKLTDDDKLHIQNLINHLVSKHDGGN